MENTSPTPQKKGLGALTWVGIGCGGIIVLLLIGGLILVPKLKKFGEAAAAVAEEMKTNPTRATASTRIITGIFEMAAEDAAHKRYTVREKQGGKLTTIYWDAKANAPATVEGDFTAIPAAESAPAPAAEPEPAAK